MGILTVGIPMLGMRMYHHLGLRLGTLNDDSFFLLHTSLIGFGIHRTNLPSCIVRTLDYKLHSLELSWRGSGLVIYLLGVYIGSYLYE